MLFSAHAEKNVNCILLCFVVHSIIKIRKHLELTGKEDSLSELIGNFRCWITETDPEVLKSSFKRILHDSGYSVLNFVEHHFSPYGYTCLWLLGESHFAVHTFPEKDATYIELSGCNSLMNRDFILKTRDSFYIKELLELEI